MVSVYANYLIKLFIQTGPYCKTVRKMVTFLCFMKTCDTVTQVYLVSEISHNRC